MLSGEWRAAPPSCYGGRGLLVLMEAVVDGPGVVSLLVAENRSSCAAEQRILPAAILLTSMYYTATATSGKTLARSRLACGPSHVDSLTARACRKWADNTQDASATRVTGRDQPGPCATPPCGARLQRMDRGVANLRGTLYFVRTHSALYHHCTAHPRRRTSPSVILTGKRLTAISSSHVRP